MNSFVNKIISALAIATTSVFASVDPEMEGMEVVSRDDGTFLVGSPTFYFDRPNGAGGIHSESELWTPRKLHYRLLFNRMSVLPSWNPIETPSIWMKTGNELGDMIYQDFLTDAADRPDNRTPILEGVDTIMGWMDEFGITLESLGLGSEQAEGVATLEVTSLLGNIGQYAGTIMSTTMNVGKVIFNFAVAFMLSMYILAEKDKLKKGCGRLIKAIVGESNYGGVCTFLHKSNVVFNSYIVYNLIDSLIIGGFNAVFMLILGMDYMGLISFIVAIFNLIPTFGPLIGGAIGAFKQHEQRVG